MGIFNSINQRSGLVVGTIVIGLLLFLLGDAFTSPNSIFSSFNNKVGEIDGTNITIDEYQRSIVKAEALYGGSNNNNNMEDLAWNQLVFDNLNKNIYQKDGIEVSAEEKIDIIEGDHMSEIIKQQFGSIEGLAQFKKYLESNQFQSEEERIGVKGRWNALREYVYDERMRSKFDALIKKSEYVTKAEAKRYYHSINDKVEAEYVYVPFFSIKDTIAVTDAMIEKYIKEHAAEFQVEEGRSIEFAVFNNTPTSEDSAYVKKDLAQIENDFKFAKNDTAFIRANSDVVADPAFVQISQLPTRLANMANTLQVDSVYGPFATSTGYSLTKIIKIESDTNVMAKASHILFRTNETDPAEKKVEAKKLAQQVLSEIQNGASFEKMAAQYGGDGTAANGGDLGWFGKGQMVKPFENAIFNANKSGVLPSIVETQFGYHIIRVDVPKMGKKFLVATVQNNIEAFDATVDSVYRTADAFAASVKDTGTFRAELKKFKSGVSKYEQQNIDGASKSITGVTEAREIVKWIYNEDRDVNDVSDVFSIGDKQIVVLVTRIREKGLASAEDVKDQVKPKIENEEKAKKIAEKLKATGGDFAAIAKAYGSDATTGKASDITLSSGMITGVGYEPEAVGTLFGLAKDKTSQVLTGENGMLIVKNLNFAKSEVADYSQFVSQLQQQRNNRIAYGVIEAAIKKTATIEDKRYRF
ncbi:peptidylprolyl isomerase [uncultured Cytophaga sp.]|uniref:peptidylprolyl isomerase n=1 Tax=uncultured Cytophaga sp. TaxID=160238 RepID=UPI0026199EA5|nr:peptidylprolyl isomerase [uncultured Cytophaga sp.]